MPKVTLEQKRLDQIRTQIYGKQPFSVKNSKDLTAKISPKPIQSVQLQTSLRDDLVRISLASLIIFSLQFALYYLVSTQRVNLAF